MNKILIVVSQPAERALIGEKLYDLIENGTELFFTGTREHALEILEREHPNLIFVDVFFVEENTGLWERYGGHLIVLSKETLGKPLLQAEEIVESCSRLLDPKKRGESALQL